MGYTIVRDQTMLPRLTGRGTLAIMARTGHKDVLQWGRDQLIAESAKGPLQKNIRQQASMGRAVVLQWGATLSPSLLYC
jgi:hypothetical protein